MNLGREQLALFDSTERNPRRRFDLDAMSWVEHVTGWLTDGPELMRTLLDAALWEQRTRRTYGGNVIEPRLTAEYRVLAEAPIERLREVGSRLEVEYGLPYERAWLNLYRDQNDSTSWHADKPCHPESCLVPVVSLGETRRFQIKPAAGGRSVTFVVGDGDLIVMGGRCQRDWVHAVPKETSPRRARISINFASSLQAPPRSRAG